MIIRNKKNPAIEYCHIYENCDFVGLDLNLRNKQIEFKNCRFTECFISDTRLIDCTFNNCYIKRSHLENPHLVTNNSRLDKTNTFSNALYYYLSNFGQIFVTDKQIMIKCFLIDHSIFKSITKENYAEYFPYFIPFEKFEVLRELVNISWKFYKLNQ